MQRRVAGAADELQPQQVEDFLAWYDSRSTSVRESVDGLLGRSGDDAVETIAELDDEGRAILMTDGGEAADDIIRAADDIGDTDTFLGETLGELDDQIQREAIDFIEENGEAGVRLVRDLDELGDDALERVLRLDIDSADELRGAFARLRDQGHATPTDINDFARHVDNLEGVDGLNSGPVADVISAGRASDFDGALRHVQVADDIGAGNIDRMNIEVGPQGVDGELDIKLQSGEVIEVKSSFGVNDQSTFSELENKLTAMREHPDTALDGNTLEIRSGEVANEDRVREIINEWESTVASSQEWNNADVDIRVVDDSTGNVIG